MPTFIWIIAQYGVGKNIRNVYGGFDLFVGRRIWARYPDGRLIRWHYPIRDQVVEQQTWCCDELSSSLVARVSYDYDDSGRLLKAENAAA
ncbi:hypothetical protein, partial [Yersinia aldovae]|uniref:hypothetical protein n=1 Tax=Yersinia aldovae TaxID=29483 RepID=UPI00066FB5AD